jgi:CheY-like chemotaxis protein
MNDQNKPQILVVDDDENIRTLLEFLLRKQYRVVLRENGMRAMDWLMEGNWPDLMLIDLEMPELHGFGLLEQVRASGYFGKLPVVILSAYEKPEVRQRCLAAGANDYLIKPFNPNTVLAILL